MITLAKRISEVVQANGRFGRFAPEVHREVRQAQITGSELERLRQRRQMLREMTPEQLLQVIEFRHERLTFFDALELAKQGYLIIPHDINHKIVTKINNTEFCRKNYHRPVWTGTIIVYEEPDTPFGE